MQPQLDNPETQTLMTYAEKPKFHHVSDGRESGGYSQVSCYGKQQRSIIDGKGGRCNLTADSMYGYTQTS